MNLDSNGLPVQANGDDQDQLQRTGMVGVGQILNPGTQLIARDVIDKALFHDLQPNKGVYTRFVGGPTNTATGDQLVPVMAYWTITGNRMEALEMHHLLAQNYVSIFTGGKTFPDFILFRMIPFLIRLHWILYPLTVIFDIFTLAAVLVRIRQASETDTDDNNTIITAAVCKSVMPTPLSILAAKIYKRYRKAPGLVGALEAYHAASTGGNPEIAQLWIPIVEKF